MKKLITAASVLLLTLSVKSGFAEDKMKGMQQGQHHPDQGMNMNMGKSMDMNKGTGMNMDKGSGMGMGMNMGKGMNMDKGSGMGMGMCMGMMGNMSEEQKDMHMRAMQAHMLQMHDLANQILAEKDPKKKQELKDQQIELMKAHMSRMMQMKQNMMQNPKHGQMMNQESMGSK